MNNLVLLVVDTQKGIMTDRLYAFDKLKSNINELIIEARSNGVEVIFIRHDDGPGSGFSAGDEAHEIYDGFAPQEGERIFDKSVSSSFHESTGLLKYLRSKDVSTVIAVGLLTDYCMDATIKSGFEHGFKMIVPEYCNSTVSNDYMDAETTYKFYNESMWPKRYARCVSMSQTVDMIREYVPVNTEVVSINGVGTQTIETDRLILRKFTYDDADSMLRNWAGAPDVQLMYGEPVYSSIEEVKELLDKYIGGYSSDTYFRWAVILKENGECIGQAAYFLVDEHNHFGEIEYCIGKKYQGRGYATEATKALIDYGFKSINYHKVQICVRPSNTPSCKVIEKCGFVYEGTLRDYFYMNGHYEGRKYYSILKSEWN